MTTTSTLEEFGYLSQQAYSMNNQATGPVVAGWTPVHVDGFTATSSSFAAQLYTDGNGHYRAMIRGSDDAMDFASADAKFAAGAWDAQMADAIRFVGDAMLRVQGQSATPLSMDQLRASFEVGGHSLGGGLSELDSKFFGIGGMSIDGPGALGPTQSAQFQALKDELRANGLTGPQDDYAMPPGTFEARQYTVVGTAGTHLSGVDLVASDKLQTYLDGISNVPSSVWAFDMGAIAVAKAAEGIGLTAAEHPLGNILGAEGIPTFAEWNLQHGLSPSGLVVGTSKVVDIGNLGAVTVTASRDAATGQMVETLTQKGVFSEYGSAP